MSPVESEDGSVVSPREEYGRSRVGRSGNSDGMIEGSGGEEGGVVVVRESSEVILVQRRGELTHSREGGGRKAVSWGRWGGSRCLNSLEMPPPPASMQGPGGEAPTVFSKR